MNDIKHTKGLMLIAQDWSICSLLIYMVVVGEHAGVLNTKS